MGRGIERYCSSLELNGPIQVSQDTLALETES
jgi:hypothetical protein